MQISSIRPFNNISFTQNNHQRPPEEKPYEYNPKLDPTLEINDYIDRMKQQEKRQMKATGKSSEEYRNGLLEKINEPNDLKHGSVKNLIYRVMNFDKGINGLASDHKILFKETVKKFQALTYDDNLKEKYTAIDINSDKQNIMEKFIVACLQNDTTDSDNPNSIPKSVGIYPDETDSSNAETKPDKELIYKTRKDKDTLKTEVYIRDKGSEEDNIFNRQYKKIKNKFKSKKIIEIKNGSVTKLYK